MRSRAPPSGAVWMVRVPPWATTMSRAIGRPEAGAAAVAGAVVVEPDEPVEDALAIVGGDARAVVGDGEFGAAAVGGRG